MPEPVAVANVPVPPETVNRMMPGLSRVDRGCWVTALRLRLTVSPVVADVITPLPGPAQVVSEEDGEFAPYLPSPLRVPWIVSVTDCPFTPGSDSADRGMAVPAMLLTVGRVTRA